MALLTPEIDRLVAQARLGFVATVCADGTPNLSPKGTTLVLDGEHLVFADIRSPRTVANLRERPAVEVNVVEVGSRRGWRFKGTGRVVDGGGERERLFAWYAERGHDLRGRADRFVVVRVVRVAELTSPAYDWGETQEELVRFYADWYGDAWRERLQVAEADAAEGEARGDHALP